MVINQKEALKVIDKDPQTLNVAVQYMKNSNANQRTSMDNSLGLQNSHIRTDITYTQTENTDSLSKLESRIQKLEEEDEEIKLAP